MTCCIATAAVALAGAAWLGWVVYISGVGSLHYACHHDIAYPYRAALMSVSGMDPDESCSYTYGWYWFLTFFQFCAVIYAGVAAVTRGHLKAGALVLLAIITTLLLNSTKVFLSLLYNVGDVTPPALMHTSAIKCALAGGIICVVFNALLAIALGWRQDCECEDNCCGASGTKAAALTPAVDKNIQAGGRV